MRKRIVGAAALALTSAGLVGPATASAACDTAVNCAVERVNTTVDTTVDLALQKVDETKAFVDKTVADTTALAFRTLDETVYRAGAGEHVCVLQGRYYAATSTVTGVADCSHRGRGAAYADATKVRHGTFVANNVTIGRSQTANWLQFNDPAASITITNDAGGATAYGLQMRSSALGAAVYTGTYGSTGPADRAVAAFALLGTSGLDPAGNPNDAFVQGALVLEALA